MKPSPTNEVRKMYEETANSYARMMDTEIGLPVYADILGRLRDRLMNTSGEIVDTACGSGHMLSMYHDCYDQNRPLLGIDISPRMVSIAEKKLGSHARVVVGVEFDRKRGTKTIFQRIRNKRLLVAFPSCMYSKLQTIRL